MKLATFLLFCSLSVAMAPVTFNGKVSLGGKSTLSVTPASGGPNAWYDAETFANTDTDDFTSSVAQLWSPITVGQAGLATKARIYLSTRFGDCITKMALYSNDGSTLLANGQINCTAGNQYWEITFNTPVSVTATTYQLFWANENGNYGLRYKASSGTWKANNTSSGYAGSPPSSLPTPDFNLSRGYAVSLFVQ